MLGTRLHPHAKWNLMCGGLCSLILGHLHVISALLMDAQYPHVHQHAHQQTDRTIAYVGFAKVASTSFRNMWLASPDVYSFYSVYCRGSATNMSCSTFTKRLVNNTGFVHVIYSYLIHGLCAHYKNCKYVTLLRNPVERIISGWNYFCLNCLEAHKFCNESSQNHIRRDLYYYVMNSQPRNTCPKMGIVEYASRVGNVYTKALSHTYLDNVLRQEQTDHSINMATLDLAFAVIRSKDMLVLLTEDLETGLAQAFLSDFTGGARFRVPPVHVHMQESKTMPSIIEMDSLEKLLSWDIQLYNAAKSLRDKRRAKLLGIEPT